MKDGRPALWDSAGYCVGYDCTLRYITFVGVLLGLSLGSTVVVWMAG